MQKSIALKRGRVSGGAERRMPKAEPLFQLFVNDCPMSTLFDSHLRAYIAKITKHGGGLVSLVIYTKPGCPYCQQARDHYNSKGIAFIDYDAQNNRAHRAEMFKYSNGAPTDPCIVEDGKYLGS